MSEQIKPNDPTSPSATGSATADIRRKAFWAYVREADGEPLPSTIRERQGDCQSAIKNNYAKYSGLRVRIERVIVEWNVKLPNITFDRNLQPSSDEIQAKK